MPERKRAKKATQKSAKKSGGLTAEERAALKETIRERKGQTGESDVLEKISEMKGSDRAMAKRIHAIVKEAAPDLAPKTWYGMPAYANEDGKVVCYFTPASKFKERYATFGFNATANLDDGEMWPTSFALKKVTPAEEKKIRRLVKKATT